MISSGGENKVLAEWGKPNAACRIRTLSLPNLLRIPPYVGLTGPS
jgi:hypothetical protein